MSAISAQDVNKLRQMTGAGMMDCKKALTEAEGDFEKAIEIHRIHCRDLHTDILTGFCNILAIYPFQGNENAEL